MIGAVGKDEFGHRIRAALDADGIDTTGLLVADEPTGTAHIVVDATGENSIVVVPGANGSVRTLADDHREVIRTSDVLLLQLELPIEVVNEAATWAAEHATRVVLTLAPVAPLPGDLLAAVDLLVPNEHEAGLLTGGLDARDAALRRRRRGVDAVAVTTGRRGCVYADSEGVVQVAALDVEAIDTSAAGDTFVAALSVALAEGRPVAPTDLALG